MLMLNASLASKLTDLGRGLFAAFSWVPPVLCTCYSCDSVP